ncbi:hypothetical protein ACI782_25135 [Geodermatophilus sp. SYSU D00703]
MARRQRRALWIGGALVIAAAVAGGLVSGTFDGSDEADGADGAAAAVTGTNEPPQTYGAPLTERPEPTSVATDPPRPTATSTSTGRDEADAEPDADGGAAEETSEGSPETAVLITWSGWSDALAGVEAGGYADVVESGGSCTLTLSNGTATASATSAATQDVSSTTCGPLVVPRDELATGTWQAVLSYDSPSTSGESEPVQVTVP